MNLTRLSLDNPVAVIVALLLATLFGVISLDRLPVQLIPEIQEPEITIRTSWRAAAPNEVETEIIRPQEDVLRGLPGMTKLLAKAQEGRGEITITFSVDMDLRRALVEVINRLNQVPSYPDDVDEPTISTIGGNARAIAWFIIKPAAGNDRDISSYKNYIEEVVQTRFERVPGVARSELYGGREREIRITFDPYKTASLGIQIPAAANLISSGTDVSGGFVDIGKRKYSLRFAGKFPADDLQSLIMDWRDGHPVYLRDIAVIEERLVDRDSFVINNGDLSIAVNAQRETGVNVLQVMAGLQVAMRELADGPLARANLTIDQVYDETTYIDRSIEMLSRNLGMGIILAIIVLWWFLRHLRTTLLVAISIPTCLLTSFIVLEMTGRTLNVISLAGLAFAVGMVLDASIVVLENIVRLREQGKEPDVASLLGTSQVWGALLASTVTTVAVFLPIVFLGDEAGQLFTDLAITIISAICVSLIVAVTVIPSFAKHFMGEQKVIDPHHHWWVKAADSVMLLSNGPVRRAFWIVILIAVPLTLAWMLLPKADYLPEGNRNLVFAYILPPPGANIAQIEKEMGDVIAQRISPYVKGEKTPQVKNYFFVAFPRGVFMGVRASNPEETEALIPILNDVIQGFPDTIAFAKRASLFGGFGEGRSIDMDLHGRNIGELMNAAVTGFALIHQKIPGASVRPFPGLELAQPELRLIPNDRRISEAGWDRNQVAGIIRALGDGLYVGDYFNGEETLDIIVRSRPWQSPEELAGIPLATPNAGILPLGELVRIQRTSGPEEIRRINRRRTVTLQITPPDNLSLEETLDILRTEVEPDVRAAMPIDGDIDYTGAADKLESAIRNMRGSFILAIFILYLLMSALFQSFKDSLLVILSIPLATVGGVIALNLMNTIPQKFFNVPLFQAMDLLTMIGFIILLGLVVNNAILLVHQTRLGEREGMSRRDAVAQAVNIRLRPILMSTLTSIFGMLPLLLIPGPGAELYRGLAGVIVGGMMISTVFTLLLLPCMLRIGEGTTNRPIATA
ncbi:MAG: efflux RND transporter permease subunit [Proteobacteria bacterium]|nr:efflux RND transporter permease subunit [Pseudomonadota bacterium]